MLLTNQIHVINMFNIGIMKSLGQRKSESPSIIKFSFYRYRLISYNMD